MTKRLFARVALVGIVLFAGGAEAAGKVRVGVLSLRGAGEGPVRAKISAVLKAKEFLVVGPQQLERSASDLGVSLDGDAGFRAVAKELNISAFVLGEMTRKHAELTVRNGADGAVLGDASFAGANPKKIAAGVAANFWRQLGGAVKQGRPPAGGKTKAAIVEEAPPPDEEAAGAAAEAEAPASAAPPPPERKRKNARKAADEPPPATERADVVKSKSESAPEPVAAEGETSGGGAAPIALAFGLGGRALFRRLDWHQNLGQLPPYSLSPGPEAGIWFEAFPVAFVKAGFAANVGVFGNFNYGFAVVSTTTSTTVPSIRYTTKFQDWMAGLKVRVPARSFAPYLSFAYGVQSFSLTSSTGAPTAVPGVDYKFFRLGAGTRIDIDKRTSVDVSAAFLTVTDPGSKAGQIRSTPNFFPRTTASGVDLSASFCYRVLHAVGVRAGVDFRQYGLDFRGRNGDVPLVGGAVDRYIVAWGGVELLIDGVGRTDDEKESEAPAPASKDDGEKDSSAKPEAGN